MTAKLRCAVYTRKSTEEGLDQAFSSLDAQREACEAYIHSQVGEGWKIVCARYDDGGYSGGNLNRPAMQRLLTDVEAGEIDVIVVYKVDRLTRSLIDFAKIVDRLDAKGVSFVSVTQAFNTTTSMGRLTLNVLLSFAQFEREVTGERIRDKIAASKAKGMWMGGNVPLGYDLQERKLVVNSTEAKEVRHIFSRYLELGSGVALAKELRGDGTVSKRWISRSGQQKGGLPFSCGALYYLLQNRLYLGHIVHRGFCHRGEHEAIVSCDLFEGVQEALADRRRQRRVQPRRTNQCFLAGLVRDSRGQVMSTTFSYGRGGRLYRYYVSGSLDPLHSADSPPRRFPAGSLERLVLEVVRGLFDRPIMFEEAVALITAVELHDRSIQIALVPGAILEPHEPAERALERLQSMAGSNRVVADSTDLRIIVDRKPVFRGGKAARGGATAPASDGYATSLLRLGHKLLVEHSMSPLSPEAHTQARAPSWQRQRRVMTLGLLSPQLQKAILQGTLSGSIDALLSETLPLAWADQTGTANGPGLTY